MPPATALAPGEFWHDVDKGLLYYQLAEGQTVDQLNSDVWIASEEVLLTYNGTSAHSWENVQFSYSTWMQSNAPDGFVENQAAVFACSIGTDGCGCTTTKEMQGLSATTFQVHTCVAHTHTHRSRSHFVVPPRLRDQAQAPNRGKA